MDRLLWRGTASRWTTVTFKGSQHGWPIPAAARPKAVALDSRDNGGVANRLTGSISPYLQAHADNPVDWWEWGDDAFAAARGLDVPIFLSVGYAACHWCHVMAHESFEDPAVARILNERFICIKVDREERPDVDSVYMAATTALTGHGGWPMSAWLDHEGRVFHAGTYYPPRPSHGMPSFTDVLLAVAAAWSDRRAEVLESAAHINEVLSRRQAGPDVAGPETAEASAGSTTGDAVASLTAQFDSSHGGFGGSPKFPPGMVLQFLFRSGQADGDNRAVSMAAATCEAMGRGGMYDQLGGGFARYSVDATWTVPHFEKMLYDNALLAGAYADWWAVTGEPTARRICEETIGFLTDELALPGGGFAAALDADAPPTPGQPAAEGATYVWRPEQFRQVLGHADGIWAAELTSVTPGGTFDGGTSVLQLREDPNDWPRWQRCRALLLAARNARPQPARDDKLVASWNGLAIAALVRSGLLLAREDWLAAAVAAGEVLRSVNMVDGRLRRVSRAGRAGAAAGLLEDYAVAAEAFLALERATGDVGWYAAAEQLTAQMVDLFCDDPSGAAVFHDTAVDAERLVRRPRDTSDGASPSGVAAAAKTLVMMAAVSGRHEWRDIADKVLAGLQPQMAQQPRFAGWALQAELLARAGPLEVGVVAPLGDRSASRRLLQVVEQEAGGQAVAVAGAASQAAAIPLLRGKTAATGRPAAYVCRDFTCGLPAVGPDELRLALRA